MLIATFGPGWAFILNAASYIPGILAIVWIKVVYQYHATVETHPLQAFKDGLRFSFTNRKLVYFMFMGASAAIFIWPYQTLMPVVAERIFHTGASGFGSLLSAAGLGSLTGAIFTSAQTKRENKKNLIFAGLLICTLSLLAFSLNRNFALAHVLLFGVGFGIITFIATVNTLVQLLAPDDMRGRVMSVYLTMFVGMMPIGNTLAGTIADRTSAVFSIGLGATVVLLLGVYLFLTHSLDQI